MEIVLIVLGAVAVYLIGYVVGAVKNTPELPSCCQTCLRDHDNLHYHHLSYYGRCCDHFGCWTLRQELSQARSEVDYYKREAERRTNDFRNYTAQVANRPTSEMWFKSVGDKDRAAEKLKEAMKPLQELQKELTEAA